VWPLSRGRCASCLTHRTLSPSRWGGARGRCDGGRRFQVRLRHYAGDPRVRDARRHAALLARVHAGRGTTFGSGRARVSSGRWGKKERKTKCAQPCMYSFRPYRPVLLASLPPPPRLASPTPRPFRPSQLGMGLPWHWQHSSRWQVPATPSRFFQCGGPAFSPATGDFKRIQDAIQDALEREGVRAESDPEAAVSLPSGWARVDVADIMEGQAVQHCMFVCVVCVVSCLCLCSMMRK